MGTNMHPGLLWMIAGLVLLGLEILAPGVFMMWLGIAAILAGLIVWQWDWGFGAQVGIFSVLAAIALFIGMRLRPSATPVMTNQLAGVTGRPAIALSFTGREGRVRLGDSDWSARLISGVPVPEPGTPLRVEGVEGTILLVRPDD